MAVTPDRALPQSDKGRDVAVCQSAPSFIAASFLYSGSCAAGGVSDFNYGMSVVSDDTEQVTKADNSLKFPGSTTASYAVSSGYSFPSGTAGDFSVEGWIKITHSGRYWFSYASSSNNNCLLVSSNVGTYGSWVHWAMNVASNRAITHYINLSLIHI